MSFCPFCGSNNADNSTFCVSCGRPLSQSSNQNQGFNTNSTQQNNQYGSNSSSNNDFVSSDEYVVATLANGMVDNVLSGEGLKTESAVLTNKRLYYNHKTGIVNIHTQNEKVNVKDITGTKIATINPLGLLVMSGLALLIGIIVALADEDEELLLPFLPIALCFAIAYIFAKKSFLKIEYAGGSIRFSVKKYGKENIHNFQKAIYSVKDRIDAENK